jgi:hypothetical protein
VFLAVCALASGCPSPCSNGNFRARTAWPIRTTSLSVVGEVSRDKMPMRMLSASNFPVLQQHRVSRCCGSCLGRHTGRRPTSADREVRLGRGGPRGHGRHRRTSSASIECCGPQFLIDTTNTGRGLLSGHQRGPLLGHQRVLFMATDRPLPPRRA